MPQINRRAFTLGGTALALSASLTIGARAQETRTVTTIYGTYDIPAEPKRVVAIDSRLDLQPAIALGLPVIGHGHSIPGPWVPKTEGLEFFGSEVNLEQVLAADPDMILCAAYDPDSVWWPANRLKEIAPVVPVKTDLTWKAALRDLAATLGLEGKADSAIGEYDALITDIKARRVELIASKTVVSIQPGDGVLYVMNGSTMLQTQVLADLGAKTIPPAEGQRYDSGEIPAEAFGETLGQVDGILLATTAPDSMAGLEGAPLWQRLAAVKAGALVASNGNINYGSIYSAIQVAKLVDELYGKLV